MTAKTKKEYSKTVAERYLQAKGRKEKTKILDEYCATLKYHRKSGVRRLRKINFHDPPAHRSREKLYSQEANSALIKIWRHFGCICAERLHPFLSEAIRILEKFGHIEMAESVKRELLAMSRPTIGRRITDHRKRFGGGKGLSATKPGSLLKRHIPVQTQSWDIARPGFLEMDLVAHCGGSLSGDFIFTLQTVDICTTWTERKAVMGKSQGVVFAGILDIEKKLPFPVLGYDSDNGSEFINEQLWKYCRERGIVFTRSRPYMKKDNAHIEQKNWPLVRKILGYDRFDTGHQLALINDLYDNELRLYLNFFQPSLKLASKERFGAKIRRKYNGAKTPYRRVLDCVEVPETKKAELRALYETLDPVKLKRRIDKKIKIIISLVR
jgi:hypothetical protein